MATQKDSPASYKGLVSWEQVFRQMHQGGATWLALRVMRNEMARELKNRRKLKKHK